MRVYARRGTYGNGAVEGWLARERAAGLFEQQTYDRAAESARHIRSRLLALLHEFKRAGRRVAGYGASAKGNTLLNYCGIGTDLLEYIVDRNPLKQGLYSPGRHIPIVSPEKLSEDRPDYLLLLAWNFAEEIMEEQAEFRAQGGQFILPIPMPEAVA